MCEKEMSVLHGKGFPRLLDKHDTLRLYFGSVLPPSARFFKYYLGGKNAYWGRKEKTGNRKVSESQKVMQLEHCIVWLTLHCVTNTDRSMKCCPSFPVSRIRTRPSLQQQEDAVSVTSQYSQHQRSSAEDSKRSQSHWWQFLMKRFGILYSFWTRSQYDLMKCKNTKQTSPLVSHDNNDFPPLLTDSNAKKEQVIHILYTWTWLCWGCRAA